MSNPNISFRESPDQISQLKDLLNEEVTAAAIRFAINHTINCEKVVHELHVLHDDVRNLLSVQKVAQILNKDDSTIRRMLYADKIKGLKIGGTWVIPKSAIMKLLIPVIRRQN